jgi:lipopolysaccharide/colanic/teichoic acid biosynthesis glycosyltransferase
LERKKKAKAISRNDDSRSKKMFGTKKKQQKAKQYNNPQIEYILINLFINSGIFFFVVSVFPFVNDNPTKKYAWPFYAYQLVWILLGISFKKYLPLRHRTISNVVSQTTKSDFLALLVGIGLLIGFADFNFSIGFLLALTASFLISEFVLISLFYAFGEAQLVETHPIAASAAVQAPSQPIKEEPLDQETAQTLQSLIRQTGGQRLLEFLKMHIHPFVTTTLFVNTTSRLNIEMIHHHTYNGIVNLKEINHIREINAFFGAVNERLPNGGIFIGCFETKSQRKKRILGNHPSISQYLHYGMDFIIRRVLPKLNLTREYYFWLTNGIDRVMSKTEVFGRLYFTGFEVIDQRKIKGLTYVIARKTGPAKTNEVANYSPIIKLQRIGKNGTPIKVYKLRTMHPYSEYLQDYIYKHHHLHQSGKFKTDIRVTTLGGFLRRYWLDEIPMIINVLKRDLKLVGIRPLSKQYFNLYSPDLQAQRMRHRPGLLPPYYADLPKTLEAIQESEKKYLDACEKKGTFITDFRYFFIILYHILFKKARSK